MNAINGSKRALFVVLALAGLLFAAPATAGMTKCLCNNGQVIDTSRNGERGWTYPLLPQSLRIDLGNAFEQQMAHFCEVIRGLEAPRIDARDAMATLAATLAVFEASESGGTVRP